MDDFTFDAPLEVDYAPYPEVSDRYAISDFESQIPETIAPEIQPYSNEGRNYITGYVPDAIQATIVPSGGNFGDIGGSIFRGLDGLASIYGKILSLDSQREAMRVNRDVTRNNLDIARIQSDGKVRVATAEQTGQVNRAVKDADNARNGGVFSNAGLKDNQTSILIGLAGLGVAVYFGSKGKK